MTIRSFVVVLVSLESCRAWLLSSPPSLWLSNANKSMPHGRTKSLDCRLLSTISGSSRILAATSSRLFMADRQKQTEGSDFLSIDEAEINGEDPFAEARTAATTAKLSAPLSTSNLQSDSEKVTAIYIDDNHYADDGNDASSSAKLAATGTVNERLMAELNMAASKEKSGSRTALGKKLGLDQLRPRKSEEERRAALEEARNLNGVNPVVALTGSIFALAIATGLWLMTTFLADFFATHPIAETDLYFVQRVAAVFRNVVMGLVALASGFFFVTGLGILLLGIRVAYGVMTGELDPTPLAKKKNAEEQSIEIARMWDLMMNQKPGRRGRGGKN